MEKFLIRNAKLEMKLKRLKRQMEISDENQGTVLRLKCGNQGQKLCRTYHSFQANVDKKEGRKDGAQELPTR